MKNGSPFWIRTCEQATILKNKPWLVKDTCPVNDERDLMLVERNGITHRTVVFTVEQFGIYIRLQISQPSDNYCSVGFNFSTVAHSSRKS